MQCCAKGTHLKTDLGGVGAVDPDVVYLEGCGAKGEATEVYLLDEPRRFVHVHNGLYGLLCT